MTDFNFSDTLLKGAGCLLGMIIFYWIRLILLGLHSEKR